jgi:cytoskeletal protein CcmA (bactofilin family)
VPKNRKVNTLDSYATIRAVARTKHAPKPTLPVAPTPDAPASTDAPLSDPQKLGARVARTTVPVKHQIECYECSYKFQVHGRATTTHCPKCRALLDFKDHTIDTEWVDTVKTAGTIRLTPTGVLKGGNLIGAEVILEGIIEGGRARALRVLELGAGAIFSEKAVSAPDLRIAAGADFKFKQEIKYRNVEISGTLRVKLTATGVVTVKPGGLLEGEIQAEHLIVEDGGGLKAKTRIAPKSAAVPDDEETA